MHLESGFPCEECGGMVYEHGSEAYCDTCGLIYDSAPVDRGAEWRAFDADETKNRKRTGATRTHRLPDNGLRTRITATGNIRSQNPLKASRMNHQEYRARTENSHTREAGLSEINRLGSALELPESYIEQAAHLFKRVHANGISGLTLEGVCGAVFYIVCRKRGTTRSLHEIKKHLPEKAKTRVAYRNLRRNYDFETPIMQASEYVGRYARYAEIGDDGARHAERIARQWAESDYNNGKNPSGVAVAAVYLAGKFSDEPDVDVTQAEAADIGDVSTVTVRTRMLEMCELIGENPLESGET